MNGKPTTIDLDPMDNRKGTWKLTDTANPISVGDGPSIFTLGVQYYDSNGAAIPAARGGYNEVKLNVYKVEWVDLVDLFNKDTVYELTPLVYSSDVLYSADPTPQFLQKARHILAHFNVRSPADPNTGQPITTFAPITVGIAQTVAQFTGGSVLYSRLDDLSPAIL